MVITGAESPQNALESLHRLSFRELQVQHAELFGETPLPRNKQWLVKRIAWRLQANALGDLSERARARIAELANDADLRVMAPRTPGTVAVPAVVTPPAAVGAVAGGDARLPKPGTVITRPYKGRMLQVTVLADGFEHEGVVYRTLSAVAKAITGSHTNGFLFFKLGGAR